MDQIGSVSASRRKVDSTSLAAPGPRDGHTLSSTSTSNLPAPPSSGQSLLYLPSQALLYLKLYLYLYLNLHPRRRVFSFRKQTGPSHVPLRSASLIRGDPAEHPAQPPVPSWSLTRVGLISFYCSVSLVCLPDTPLRHSLTSTSIASSRVAGSTGSIYTTLMEYQSPCTSQHVHAHEVHATTAYSTSTSSVRPISSPEVWVRAPERAGLMIELLHAVYPSM